uniref:Uncharacterized protein n=1 Tax=Anguilla anguilla TaxID=7936 RepID=A0A0E9T5R0_ANGAN
MKKQIHPEEVPLKACPVNHLVGNHRDAKQTVFEGARVSL